MRRRIIRPQLALAACLLALPALTAASNNERGAVLKIGLAPS